ncbi:MAG: zinc dependent phospholipase C family protein [Christensenellales bacterium]
MAGIYAHYICAQAAAEAAMMPELKDSGAYALGSQGPDIMYYYNIIPFRKPGGMHGMGVKVHDENTGAFLRSMANCVNGLEKDYLKAYFYGFLTHYFLDAATHRYVKCRTASSRHHVLLETYVDSQLLASTTGIKRCWKFLKLEDSKIKDISKMLTRVLLEAHGAALDKKVFETSIKTMPVAQKALHDPLGIKLAMAKTFDFFAGRGTVARFIIPSKVKADYMNLSKEKWQLPDGESNDSFVELIDKSAFDAGAAMKTFEKAFDEGGVLKAATALGNISMATGYECRRAIDWPVMPVFDD